MTRRVTNLLGTLRSHRGLNTVIADPTPLSAPTGVAHDQLSGDATHTYISWTAVSGADVYNVRLVGTGTIIALRVAGTAGSGAYTGKLVYTLGSGGGGESLLSPATAYNVYLTALKSDGTRESSGSTPATATTDSGSAASFDNASAAYDGAAANTHVMSAFTIAAGAYVVLALRPSAGSNVVTSVTDDRGGIWAAKTWDPSAATDPPSLNVWECVAHPGGSTTITVNISAFVTLRAVAASYTNHGGTVGAAVHATIASSATSHTSANVTTTLPNEKLIGILSTGTSSATDINPGGSETRRAISAARVEIQDIDKATVGTYTTSWTLSASQDAMYAVLRLIGASGGTPVNTAVPVISGTARQGVTLTATTGSWLNGPTSYAYRWFNDGTPISGATASSYTLVSGDVAADITVGVIATNGSGSSSEAVSSAVGPVTSSAGAKKWNPGHYLDSTCYTALGNADSGGASGTGGTRKAAEISLWRSIKAAGVNIEGGELYYFWRSLENVEGVIDATSTGGGLDDDYVAMTGWNGTTHVNPLRMAIYILDTDYFSGDPATRCTPNYILTDTSLGIGYDGTRYGYWRVTGFSGVGTGSAPALYRSAVATKYKAFHTALAAHVLPDGYTVDNSPYIEWVKPYLETSALYPQDPGLGGANTDGTYSGSGLLTEIKAITVHMASAYVQTITCGMANWFDSQATAHNYVQYLAGAQCGISGPDIFGDHASVGNQGDGLGDLTPGQCSYIGLKPGTGGGYDDPWVSGGTSLIGVVPYLGTVQTTELDGSGVYGLRYFSPLSLFNQANGRLHATHVAWQYVDGYLTGTNVTGNLFGNAADLTAWSVGGLGVGDTAPNGGGVLKVIQNNPLTNTTYPTGLPA